MPKVELGRFATACSRPAKLWFGWIAPTSAPDVVFSAGDIVSLRTPGGGGHGAPKTRSADVIEADLRDGYVTSRDYQPTLEQECEHDHEVRR